MSLTGNDKENTEKLAAMWMYATTMGTLLPTSMRRSESTSRPIMLIPASSASTSLLATSPAHAPPLPMVTPPGMAYLVPPPPGSMLYAPPPPPGSIPSGTYRTHRSSKSAGVIHVAQQQQQRRRRAAQAMRSGKMEANRRQRRKSATDVIDGQTAAFQYTGLDRAIADNFLARQEQSHAGSHSHIDYSSSSSVGDTYGGRAVSRASSKTKIVCRDVVM